MTEKYERQRKYYQRNRDVIAMRRALSRIVKASVVKSNKDDIFDSFIEFINEGE